MFNVTYLFLYQDNIVGFLTISMDNITIKKLGKSFQEVCENNLIDYKNVPGVKLGRLAVDKNYQKLGIGAFMIEWLQACISMFSKRIDVRYILIDAYINVFDFYLKSKFKILPSLESQIERTIKKHEKALKVDKLRANKKTITMIFDLKDK